jgi:DNA-binding FadR family transcriptional regulator
MCKISFRKTSPIDTEENNIVKKKIITQIRKSDQISEFLSAYVIENKLSPGDALPSEVELAKTFGVGRPTIREAIKAMAGSGLVNISTGRPPTVGMVEDGAISRLLEHAMAINQVTALHTLEFRRFVEESSVMSAALNRTGEDIDKLKKIIIGLHRSEGNLDTFSKLDIEFHKTLARASGNPLVQVITEGIADVALESSQSGLRVVKNDEEWSHISKIHEDIALAVFDGHAERARAAMVLHFDFAWQRLIQYVS